MQLLLKPGVIGFIASLLLVASVAEAIQRPPTTGPMPLAIEDLDPTTTATPPEDEPAGTPAPETTSPGTRPTATQAPTTATAPPTGTPSSATTSDPAHTPARPSSGPTPAEPTPPPPSPGPTAPSTPDPEPSSPASPAGPPEAPLYNDEEKVVGISDTTISLCGHAALSLAAAFDTSPADLNVYWEMVRDQGGVYGRNVEIEWKDDAYNGNQAVTAAENCRAENPFFLLGGIGFDQIPNVRAWAEQNRMLYLHHIAVAPTSTPNYSFSLSPTVQAMGEQFGRHIVSSHPSAKVGIIWRDSENWRPGRDAGRAQLDAAGVEVVGDHGVSSNQGVYTQQLNDLRVNGAEVVWVWENALNAAQIINQASAQGWFPTWVVFPFQTTLDVLTDREQLDIDGVASWPSYAPGGYGGAFPEWGFEAEIARFEQAYAQYRPNSTPNDLLWQVWVGNKVLHQMLEDCGADCNRNRFAGMMLDGYRAQVDPACPIDFTDPRSVGSHLGGWRFFAQQSFMRGDQLYYETSRYCVPSLG